MGDVALPAGCIVATVEIAGRRADVVLHGSAGKVFTGALIDAVQHAAASGPEPRVVLQVAEGTRPGTGRYVIRSVRQQVAVGMPFKLDLDAAGLSALLVDAQPQVMALVGETTWLPATGGFPGVSMPIWSASPFGTPDALVIPGRRRLVPALV